MDMVCHSLGMLFTLELHFLNKKRLASSDYSPRLDASPLFIIIF